MGARKSRRSLAAPDERLNALSNEALECRDLRHAWPRSSSGNAKLTPTKWSGDRVTAAERVMVCDRDCGTVRTETFEITGDGRMSRVGRVAYQRKLPYLIRREAGDERPPVERDEIRYALLTRLHPDLKW